MQFELPALQREFQIVLQLDLAVVGNLPGQPAGRFPERQAEDIDVPDGIEKFAITGMAER